MNIVKLLGIIGGVSMPIWNIPLIVRIVKRRSAEDISIYWVAGVWACVMAMLPASAVSDDPVLKYFGIVNAVAFSCVFFTVLKYKIKPVPATNTPNK